MSDYKFSDDRGALQITEYATQTGAYEPVVTIHADGTVKVSRLGSEPEAAKAFWDAVVLQGGAYRTRIDELERLVLILQTDSYRSAVLNGYEVFNAIPGPKRRGITRKQVIDVLDAVVTVAKRTEM